VFSYILIEISRIVFYLESTNPCYGSGRGIFPTTNFSVGLHCMIPCG